MSERAERAQSGAAVVDADKAGGPQSEETSTVAKVKAMLTTGHSSPGQIAEVLRTHPHDRDAVLTFLHGTVGNGYVQAVVKVLGAHEDDDELEMTVTENKTKLSYADGNAHAKRTRTETVTDARTSTSTSGRPISPWARVASVSITPIAARMRTARTR